MARTQADLVREFMTNINKDIDEEEIYFPRLEDWFEKLPPNPSIQEKEVRIPGLVQIATKPRAEVAEMIIDLFARQSGLCGFKWRLGEPTITLFYIDGFKQREFEHEGEVENFKDLVVMILKARRNMQLIEWKFGEPFVIIHHD